MQSVTSTFRVFLFMLIPLSIKAQLEERLFFVYNNNVPVLNKNGDTLSLAWAGGLNSVQISEIDLNLDNVPDLFIFDRSTNKPSTFINLGIPGKASYEYAPEYEHRFPAMEYWVLLRDYNNDGRNDIFTHVNGGIKLFKNTSSKEGGVSFQQITNRLYTNLPNKNDSSNILASSQDIPLLDDIDDDGDLDILVFDKLGLFLEFNENKCTELGNCDKLNLWKVDRCWGDFSENLQDNGITLNAECIYEMENSKQPVMHAGSTILSFDLDGDKDKEILLGDVNYQSMGLLINGGTTTNAHITDFIPQFPVKNPIHIDMFPSAYYLDVNNDNKRELLVSPLFDNLSENKESVLLFENTSINDTVKFTPVKTNFLQEDMIEVGANSHPVVLDYNLDGLPDLLVSNYYAYQAGGNPPSQVHYYENIGTQALPAFKLMDENWEGLLERDLGQSIFPAFGDLNNDGFPDMIAGNEEGLLFYFQNNPAGTPNKFEGTNMPMKDDLGNPMDVGIRAAPTLFDLNGDGLLDLIIGELNGNLNYYQNTGSKESPVFQLISENLGNINLSSDDDPTTGMTVPFFFKRNGQTELFLGSEWGSIYYYDGIDNNLSGTFTEQSTAFQNINKGAAMSPLLHDLNHDGFPDLITGNVKGGLYFYKGTKYTGIETTSKTEPLKISLYPNPATHNFYLDFQNPEHALTTVKIFGVMGQLHQTLKTKKASALCNIEKLKPGIYLVQIKNVTGMETVKLIKKAP